VEGRKTTKYHRTVGLRVEIRTVKPIIKSKCGTGMKVTSVTVTWKKLEIHLIIYKFET
jgi:hypothetical protein